MQITEDLILGARYRSSLTGTALLRIFDVGLLTLGGIWLAAGLVSAGKIDLSFPAGPAILKNPTFPIGAQFWRTSVYKADCHCVKLLDPVWRPEFTK